MKKILLLACIFLSIGIYAQIPIKKTLVADETYIMASGQSNFRIITSNEAIAKTIVYQIGIIRYTASQKQDRYGSYWERSFYFYNRSWNNVLRWIDSINKLKSN